MATDNWKELKIGAGGWLVGMDIAPDNTMVVRTDTYGAYIWNGTQWQQLVTSTSMPAGVIGAQGVYEIRIAPSNTNILYMEYLGDVFRSDDKGATWTKTAFAHVTEDPNDQYRMNGQKMAVDPNNPNVVYVGTPQDGLFVTTDGGASWKKVSAVPVSGTDGSGQYPGITGITFDPASGTNGGKTNAIYASSYGHGVYESTDGGANWSLLSGGPSNVENAAISSSGVYYAVSNNTLWRYAQGTWSQLHSDNGNGFHTVAVDPFDSSRIILGSAAGTLDVSLDGGATWSGSLWGNQLNATDVPWLATTGNYMSTGNMIFDQVVPNKLWVSAGVGVWNTSLSATPAAVIWNSQSAGIEQLVANDIVVAPGGHPVLASWDRPFFYVNNPDQYPSTYGAPISGSFAAGWSVDYASNNPSFLVGIADWWGNEESGYSANGGQTWERFATMPWFAGNTMGGTIAASSPTDIVWAPANGVAPVYTKDGGQTWKPVVLPGVTDWHDFHWAYYLNKRTVTADRVLPDTFYMYYNGVFKTTDGGDTWTKVYNQEISAASGYNSHLVSVPGEAGNLFFTGGPQGAATHPVGEGFFQSTDGGSTWNAVPNVLEVSVFGFGAPATPGGYPSIYIVGYVNSVYGIWQSNDDAHSWTMIGDHPAGSLDNIQTISGDPNTYGQVYVGFAGSGYAYLPAAPAPSTPADQAPMVTATDITLAHNQNISASSLFIAADPDGQTITTYGLKDLTGNGHFVVNGVAQATNADINLTAAQLAQTTYQSGSGADQLSVRASDGTSWSNWQTFSVTAPLNQAPLVSASGISFSPSQAVARSSLFTANDPDGDTITTYALKDLTGNGSFLVNGVAQAADTEIDLTPMQLAQTTYQAGSASDELAVRAFDGTSWSDWQSFAAQVSSPPASPLQPAGPPPIISPAQPPSQNPVGSSTVQFLSNAMEEQTLGSPSGSAATGQIVFSDGTGTLIIDQSPTFAGSIAGFGGNDVLDFPHIDYAKLKQPIFSETGTAGHIKLSDGSDSVNISLSLSVASSLVASSDGHGGTQVSITEAPPGSVAAEFNLSFIYTSETLGYSGDGAEIGSSHGFTDNSQAGSITLLSQYAAAGFGGDGAAKAGTMPIVETDNCMNTTMCLISANPTSGASLGMEPVGARL